MEKIIWIFLTFGAIIVLLKILSNFSEKFLKPSPEKLGAKGEKQVNSILSKLPKNQYKSLHNIMLKTELGTTTQIDHIVVSTFGIFVIETKNYSGTITGGETSEMWTEFLGKNKYPFRNPILQNFGHVKTLENVLGLPKEGLISIITFSNSARIKVYAKTPIVNFSKLGKTIKSYKDEKFSFEEIEKLISTIESLNIDSKQNRVEHISNIKKNVEERNTKISENVCPRCGGKLRSKKGKYGNFLGCSNYPKCKFIQK